MSIVGASVLHCPAKNSLVTQTPQLIVIISQMKEDENEGDKANCNEWRKNVHMHKHTHTHMLMGKHLVEVKMVPWVHCHSLHIESIKLVD